MKHWMAAVSTVPLALTMLACQPALLLAAGRGPSLALPATPETLTRPRRIDWTSDLVTGRHIRQERADFLRATSAEERQLLAFPSTTTGWGSTSASPGAGVLLTAFGAAAGDTMPNAPACSFFGGTVPSTLYNQVFFITKAGKFVRASRSNPTASFSSLNVGGTFSHTAVTLSPSCTRAYLLDDSGKLSVVNTLATPMTVLATQQVAGGWGLAPVYEPYSFSTSDAFDTLYVPANDGTVHGWTVTLTDVVTRAIAMAAGSTYSVATSVTPILGGGKKLMTPVSVYQGVLYACDTGGNLNVFDTAAGTTTQYALSSTEIHAPPVLEIQDGSYALTDPLGNATTVPNDSAIYAFVNVGTPDGPECVWVDLIAQAANYSIPLYVDDNDAGRHADYVLKYHYSVTKQKVYLAAQDGVNVNTDTVSPAANQTLPGSTTYRSSNYVQPAETDVYASAGSAKGGPVYAFLRFNDPNTSSYAAGAQINSAELDLTTLNQNRSCKVPIPYATSPYYDGNPLDGLWSSAAMLNTTGAPLSRPPVGAKAGGFKSGGVNGQGVKNFGANQRERWGVTAGMPATPATDYAIALGYSASNTVYYPGGPVTANTNGNAAPFSAVQFLNNALNANSAAGTKNDTRPLLLLNLVTAKNIPTGPVESAPIVDPGTRTVYVVETNELFAVNYNSAVAWTDSVYDPVLNTGTMYTLFNDTYMGNKYGSTYLGKTLFCTNSTTPAEAFDGSALFCYSYYPSPNNTATPASWRAAITKFTLPLTAGTDRAVPGGNGPNTDQNYTLTDHNVNSGLLSTPTGVMALLLDPNINTATSGGGAYFALDGNAKVYQFDP